MLRDAIFSDCGRYRYQLYRLWDADKPVAMCIGLNPSTANAEDNDPTISNLIRLMHHNGYGGFFMMNLYGLVTPKPTELSSHPNPAGLADQWIDSARRKCQDVIFCWGAFKQAYYRAQKMKAKYPEALCFGRNADGSPKHPLYLKQTTKLQPFKR